MHQLVSCRWDHGNRSLLAFLGTLAVRGGNISYVVIFFFFSPRPKNAKGLLVFHSGNDCLGQRRHMTDASLACHNNHLCQWRPSMAALTQHTVADGIFFICRIFGHVSHRSEWQLVKIDFRSIFNRRCTEADYQTWHLHNQVRLSTVKSKFLRNISIFLIGLQNQK